MGKNTSYRIKRALLKTFTSIIVRVQSFHACNKILCLAWRSNISVFASGETRAYESVETRKPSAILFRGTKNVSKLKKNSKPSNLFSKIICWIYSQLHCVIC